MALNMEEWMEKPYLDAEFEQYAEMRQMEEIQEEMREEARKLVKKLEKELEAELRQCSAAEEVFFEEEDLVRLDWISTSGKQGHLLQETVWIPAQHCVIRRSRGSVQRLWGLLPPKRIASKPEILDLPQHIRTESEVLAYVQKEKPDWIRNRRNGKTGKEKCKALRKIRRRIAEANDIPFPQEDCYYEGEDCTGTCEMCDTELQYLEAKLAERKKDGLPIFLELGVEEDFRFYSLLEKQAAPKRPGRNTATRGMMRSPGGYF